MRKRELISLLSSLEIHPYKNRGQNFLTDKNFLNYIIRTVNLKSGDIVIEIGPGLGILTKELLRCGAQVYAIEIDRKLANFLRETIHSPLFTLIEGDACKVDSPLLSDADKYKIIANLPYSISSPFCFHVIENWQLPEEIFFMLQKETAERIAAKPKTKSYSALSVRMQLLFDIKILRNIPPEVFYPQPEVMSSFVHFIRKKDNVPSVLFQRKLAKVTKIAFSNRRKRLKKLLEINLPSKKSLIQKWFDDFNISYNVRAEELNVSEFLSLTEGLFGNE